MAASIMYWPKSQVAEAAIINPHPGLVGWWRFDEATGNTAKDNSIYGNDGIIYGATWVDGKYGKALSFNGVDNYVQVPHTDLLEFGSGNYTIECWVYFITGGAHTDAIISRRENPDLTVDLISLYRTNSGSVGFRVKNNGATVQSCDSGSTTINPNTWYQIIVGRRGSTMFMYINAIDVTTGSSVTGGVPDFTSVFSVGNSDSYYGYPWNGLIDEVRIYNRALSAVEIQNDFQKSPDFSSKLLAKVPKGTTQVIVTVSWQGIGSINVTIQSPSQTYTEEIVPVYQKTVYSPSTGTSNMLNIKRLSVSIAALTSDQNWYIILETSNAEDYKITVEAQK
jgi:hypothetical protein